MGKKETPNLLFRKEWWDFLRLESPETIGKAVTLLMEDYFGYEPFDTERFKPGKPCEIHERLAIPMVNCTRDDREAYASKCEKNSANARSRFAQTADTDDQMRTQANASDRIQPQANASDRERTEGNRNIREREIEKENSCFVPHADAREETPREQQNKTKQLFELSLYFLSKGIAQPMTQAVKAWDYNDTQGNWTEVKENGQRIDHSANKLAYAKGWARRCSSSFSPAHGKAMAELCKEAGLDNATVLDFYRGIHMDGTKACFIFTSKKAADEFQGFFTVPDETTRARRVGTAVQALRRNGIEFDNFSAYYEK